MNKTIHFTYMSLILTLFVLFIIGYIRQGDNKLIYESLKKDSYNYHQIYSINLEQMNTDNITVSDTLSVLKENGENILYSGIIFSDECELKELHITSGKHCVVNCRNL